jgi:ketosteroid isomerase-like protein
MSQENVEIVRRLVESWERGDWGAGSELFDDSCEVVFSTSAFLDTGEYHVGREALGAWMNFTAAFENVVTDVDQIVEAGDRVVVLARVRGRGRASGADVDAKVGAVFRLRGGKIIRYELTDRREALEAAGLRE